MTNPPFSVVVVAAEDAARVALALAVEAIPGASAVLVDDASAVVAAVREHAPLVILGDASLVTDGAEHVEAARAESESVGFVVVVERPSLTDAIFALRARVDEFLSAPSDESQLRDAVERVANAMVARRQARRGRSVLAVGATLAAVVLGAGGTLRAHALAGDDVVVAVAAQPEAPAAASDVGAALGVAVTVLDGIGDDRAEALRSLVARTRPRIAYTHAPEDAAIRHRTLHHLTIDACADAERISCYQTAESSIEFAPTVFVDIGEAIETKIGALTAAAGSSPTDDPAESVRSLATYWSRFGGGQACEPFEVARDHVGAEGGVAGETASAHEAPSPART